MAARVITKQLGGEEDLLLGEGTATQARASGDQTITRVNLAKWVTNAAALTALDTTDFVRARLGASNIPYRWAAGDSQTADGDFIISGTSGNWLKVVEQPALKNYSEQINSQETFGTISLDLSVSNVHVVITTGAATFTFDNPAPAGYACNLTVVLNWGADSGTVTWPASVVWAGGTEPTITRTDATTSVLTFFTTDNGTTWYGFLSADNMS